jgi:hypothetical protein
VSITYDAGVLEPEPGDALVTGTGRTYLVISARRQMRGKHARRFRLRCVVADGDPPAGVRVLPLRWNSRG